MSKIKAETSTENGFKETGIGLIPEDWGIKKISDIAEIKYGKQKPREKGLIPVVGSSGTYDFCRKELVNFPTLIIGRKGNAGSVQLLLLPCWPADTTFYMNWKSKNVDEKFLYYYMSLKPLSGEHAKTTMPSLQRQDLEEYQFPFLPSNEQQKISSVLSKIQQAIEQQDKIIEKTKELKRSLMHQLFTYGLRGEELKETEIGLMPESWDIVEVDSIGEIVTGTTPPTKNKEYYEGGGFQFISPADLGETKYIYKAEKEISSEGLMVSRTLPKDAILVVCIGSTTGKVGLTFKEKSTTNQQINTIICREGLNPHFVYYLLNFKSDYIHSLSTPSPVPILSKGKFQRAIIPITKDRKEQDEIAEILSTNDAKIEKAEVRKQTLQDLFKSMLQLLMTGQVRVKDIDFGEINV